MTHLDDSLLGGLGKALRYLRHEQNKKQFEVAAAAGITRGMLCSYETGKQLPSLDSLGKILDALDADLVRLQWSLDAVNHRAAAPPKASAIPPPSADPLDPQRLLGLQRHLAPEEDRALRQMLEGFCAWVRFVHRTGTDQFGSPPPKDPMR